MPTIERTPATTVARPGRQEMRTGPRQGPVLRPISIRKHRSTINTISRASACLVFLLYIVDLQIAFFFSLFSLLCHALHRISPSGFSARTHCDDELPFVMYLSQHRNASNGPFSSSYSSLFVSRHSVRFCFLVDVLSRVAFFFFLYKHAYISVNRINKLLMNTSDTLRTYPSKCLPVPRDVLTDKIVCISAQRSRHVQSRRAIHAIRLYFSRYMWV